MSNITLSQRHESYNTPDELIFSVITKETSYTPIKKTKITKGFDSEVYEVETKEGKPLIFKIRHFGSVSYKQEAWAIEESRKNNVPVPTILAIGKMKIADSEKEYTIQGKVEGAPFDEEMTKLTTQQINTVLVNAGKMLSRIHQINAGGFYQRHENGHWDFASWDRYANTVVRDRSTEKDEILHAGFSEKDFHTMTHLLKVYRDEFTCKQPVLCHGDYLPGHIFIDNNLNITSVIDFGMFSGNHPIHDFAFFAIEVPSLDISALIE